MRLQEEARSSERKAAAREVRRLSDMVPKVEALRVAEAVGTEAESRLATAGSPARRCRAAARRRQGRAGGRRPQSGGGEGRGAALKLAERDLEAARTRPLVRCRRRDGLKTEIKEAKTALTAARREVREAKRAFDAATTEYRATEAAWRAVAPPLWRPP